MVFGLIREYNCVMNLLLESLIRKIGAGKSGECLSEWANIQALGATMDKVGNVRP